VHPPAAALLRLRHRLRKTLHLPHYAPCAATACYSFASPAFAFTATYTIRALLPNASFSAAAFRRASHAEIGIIAFTEQYTLFTVVSAERYSKNGMV
jgi:hypothetical protein